MNTFCRYVLINDGPCNLAEGADENIAPPGRANCRVKQHFHEFCGGRTGNANYTHTGIYIVIVTITEHKRPIDGLFVF